MKRFKKEVHSRRQCQVHSEKRSTNPLMKTEPELHTCVFRKLPKEVGILVSLFLFPLRVRGPNELWGFLSVYPIRYLSLVITADESWANALQLWKQINESKPFEFDLTLNGHPGPTYWKLAELVTQLSCVHALTVQQVLPLIGATKLVKLLATSKNDVHGVWLTIIDLQEHNNLLEEAASTVAHLLNSDSAVLNLNLTSSGLYLSFSIMKKVGFVSALRNSKSLVYLRLRDVHMGSKAACELSNVLRAHTALELLDISENPLGDEGTIAVSNSLRVNRTLRFLFICGVNMSEAGGLCLAECLEGNSTLDALLLKDDDLGPECGIAFARALETNQTLRRLCLDYCELDEEGCRAFIGALSKNRVLKLLRINFNGIALKDKQELIRIARRENCLEVLETDDRNELCGGTNGKAEVVGADIMAEDYSMHYVRHRIGKNLGPEHDYKVRCLPFSFFL